ncbi:hypothetical protein PPTG_24830 [Phytophthora nicotianae INRA-310]|uniref:Uncharacterized protein n=1 Tax=Phytophthora nicotianae (strain INRA-310) TaxID=761204 RepID=W2PC56_PHYN3|nr:hypothetical protein PPTG_24830 [Phytophthora nicotianae INRA-310]ETM97778.1 hypothetical protein PPTG_24830 [Phytophthora nicotianae INRA-310]
MPASARQFSDAWTSAWSSKPLACGYLDDWELGLKQPQPILRQWQLPTILYYLDQMELESSLQMNPRSYHRHFHGDYAWSAALNLLSSLGQGFSRGERIFLIACLFLELQGSEEGALVKAEC